MWADVEVPVYATDNSSCFDLKVYLGKNITIVDTYNRILSHAKRSVAILPQRDNKRGFYLEPGEVALAPTGLIFDIPTGWQILIFPRSGLSLKKHIKLGNCVGVVDEDYTKQSMVIIRNDSEVRQSICHGDRVAQAQIAPYHSANFVEMVDPPEQKTSRNGGFGSTGR
jgi:dUTP pyrophosphatase